VLKRWIKRFVGLLLLGGLAGGLVYSFLPKPVFVDLSTVTRGPLQVTVAARASANATSCRPPSRGSWGASG
jgi:hypothetical protein